jgi:hypothetical protein
MGVTQPILLKDLPIKCQQLDNNRRRRKPPNQDRETPVVQAPLVLAVLPHMEADITLGTL